MKPHNFLLMGLPATGKTSFLAALWFSVQQDEVKTALVLEKLDGDSSYLNKICDSWLGYEAVGRNQTDVETFVSLWLKERNGDQKVHLTFPDTSGETFKQQWASRHLTESYQNCIKSADGGILFIHPKSLAQQPHFLPTLFRAKPELGTSAELWRAAGDHVRELFESLASINDLSDEQAAAISEAILSGGAETLIKRALDKWGKPAVFGALNYVASSGKELSERVLGALTFHNESVMEWLCASTDRPLTAKVACAHIVAPYSYQIKQFGTKVWLQTYEELRRQENHAEVNYLAALILALGLQNSSPLPTKVIGLCFEHIHQLTWNDRMPDASWVVLDPIVPHLSWIHDWDKCERLRRGLVEAFVKFRWPRELLHDCIKSDDLLDRVLQSAKRIDGGNQYFHCKD